MRSERHLNRDIIILMNGRVIPEMREGRDIHVGSIAHEVVEVKIFVVDYFFLFSV